MSPRTRIKRTVAINALLPLFNKMIAAVVANAPVDGVIHYPATLQKELDALDKSVRQRLEQALKKYLEAVDALESSRQPTR